MENVQDDWFVYVHENLAFVLGYNDMHGRELHDDGKGEQHFGSTEFAGFKYLCGLCTVMCFAQILVQLKANAS